jgi:CAAX prenyl protease-like protein
MGNLLTPAAWPRIVPFIVFMALLALRGAVPTEEASWLDARWIYPLCVVVVSGLMVYYWGRYSELQRPYGETVRLGWKAALVSVVVGLVVFKLWVVLTEPWMMLGEPTANFVPVDEEGRLMWGLIAFRWVGAALMVPVMEELFWRSFLMRWVDRPDFESVDPARVSVKAIALSTLVFMLAHTHWLGAIVAGLAYALLYRYTRSLWAPILAHAVTNGVLGVWVVLNGNWQFW